MGYGGQSWFGGRRGDACLLHSHARLPRHGALVPLSGIGTPSEGDTSPSFVRFTLGTITFSKCKK